MHALACVQCIALRYTSLTASCIVTKYLQMKVATLPSETSGNVIDWWRINSRSLTRLSIVAMAILSFPASSAASERTFSVAGSTISQRRTALDSDTVEDILYVHSNA